MSLDREMRVVLLRLEMLSHGSVQAWNPSGGHSGEPDDRLVAMVDRREEVPHLVWRQKYENASVSARPGVYQAAKAELDSWVRRAAPAESSTSLPGLILEDGEGHEAETVARRFGVAPSYVRRVRSRAGRDTETGREPHAVKLPAASRVARVRQLHEQGLSYRQIAQLLDCGVATVKRDLAGK